MRSANEFPLSSRPTLGRAGDVSECTALAVLVERAKQGNLTAQSELVHRYQMRVQGYVRSIIGPQAAVEDVSQMVLIKMFRSLGSLRDTGRFEPWLFCLTRNQSRDHLRRARLREAASLSGEEWLSLRDETDHLRRSLLVRDVQLAISALKIQDQELVTFVIAGHDQRFIAQQLGASISAVKARLRRLRIALRSGLQELWSDRGSADSREEETQDSTKQGRAPERARRAAPAVFKANEPIALFGAGGAETPAPLVRSRRSGREASKSARAASSRRGPQRHGDRANGDLPLGRVASERVAAVA